MKKLYVIAAVAMAALMLSCSKEAQIPETHPAEEATGVITINATLADLNTKVTFTPAYTDNKTTSMTLTWADGDKLRVYNHADPTQYSDFDLAAGSIGKKTGSFSGTPVTAASYDVEIINGAVDFGAQTQPSDGVTSDLKYMAQASEVTNLASISFTEFSSVLSITAQMPSTAVAAKVKSVDITASEAIFNSGNTLTITLGTLGDAGADGILHLFANLPVGDKAIPAGTTLLMHFNAPGEAHDVYTRFVELPATTFKANKLNTINVNASQSDKHAGPASCDGSDASKAYLIGDKYQMAAVPGLTALNSKKFFKLLNDIDMSGMTWTSINKTVNNDNDGFTKQVDFDGNNKTISNMPGTMFYVFKGSIKNLTLDRPTISESSARGAFAQYVQGSGNVITNVDICNVSAYDDGATKSAGGLIGTINNGVEGLNTATIKDCDVTNVVVNGSGRTGGFIGWIENAHVVLENCTCTGNTVTNAAYHYTGGLIGYVDATSSSPVTTTITLTECYTDMVVNGASGKNRVGGLIGMVERADGSITRCYAKGNINGRQYNGGLVGTLTIPSGKTFTISESAYIGGTITVTGNISAGILSSSEGAGSVTISNCYVTGAITGSGPQRAGGILGSHHNGTTFIDHCYFAGSITINAAIGGIVGWVNASGLNVNNCMSVPVELHATQVVADAEKHGSGLIIGQGRGSGTPTMIVDHCYRIPSSHFLDYTGIASINVKEDHDFITGTPAAIPQRHGLTYGYYHHGQEKDSATLSALVQRTDIGGAWDSNIWDFTEDLPRLKWMLP